MPPTVMVVDDDKELARLFRRLLEETGFNSVSFTDPLLAFKHFPGRSSKILVSDCRPENA